MTQAKVVPERGTRSKAERDALIEAAEKEKKEANGKNGEATLDADSWMRAAQAATIGLFVIALIWSVQVAQAVLVPVLLAWVIATIVLPVLRFLQKRGVPRVVAAVLITLALMTLILGLLMLLSTPLTHWLGRASELGAIVKQKLQLMREPLAALDEIRKALNAVSGNETGALKVEQPGENVVGTIYAVLTPAVTQFILFIGALVFYLIYQERFRKTVVLLLRDRDERLTALRTLSDIDESMTTYFSTFTVVNVCLGLVTALLTYAVGLPNPLLWGVLAGVLNYVPYIGPAVVTGTLAVVSLITFPTLSEAMIAPLIYVALVTVEGHFLTPALMGRRLELNPFAVFLAIAFCTWLWGAIGAFLAVPMLMVLSVSLGQAFGEEKPELPD